MRLFKRKTDTHMDQRMTIFSLSWPLIVETFLRMLYNNIDVFMLSRYSDDAVAAVGLIGQFIFFVIVLMMMVNTGATTVISQYNGSKRFDDSAEAVSGAVLLGILFGLIATLMLTLGGETIISLYGLEPAVHTFAREYLVVFGIFAGGIALSTVFAAILRAYGYTQAPMLVTLGCNMLNILGNYIVLFGPLGLPVLGVRGVAISTGVSNTLNALIVLAIIYSKKEIVLSLRTLVRVRVRSIRQILAYGVPNGGENLSYNFAQIISYRVIALSGSSALTAAVYAHTFQRMILIVPFAMMQACQILVGYLVGKGLFDEAYRKVYRIWTVTFAIALGLSLCGAVFRYAILGLFTDNPEIIAIGALLFIAAIFWETGRTFNLIFIGGLKGAGDVHFPVRVGIISMWGVAVLFSYIFGLHAGLGALGVWIAFSMDEWGRGIIMFFRWRSRRWETKGVVQNRGKHRG